MVSLESLSNIQEWINLRGGKNSEYLRTMNDSYIAIYSPNYFPQTTRKKTRREKHTLHKIMPPDNLKTENVKAAGNYNKKKNHQS